MAKLFYKDQSPHHNENYLRRATKSPIFVWCGGQSLMEILVGLGIISIMVGASTYALVTVLRSSNVTEQSQSAGLIGNSLLESASTLAEANWNAIYNLQKTLSNKYFLVRSPTTTPTTVPGYESVLEQEITYGLVGNWKLDESAGTAAYDFSGTGNLGVLTNISNINDSLEGYWKFDEGSGSTATDLSGNGNTGTLTGSPIRDVSENCKFGGCLIFDGTDDRISSSAQVTRTEALATGMTLSAWVKTSDTEGGIIHQLENPEGCEYECLGGIRVSGGKARMTIYNGTDYINSTGTTNINNGSWHYIVGVFTTDEYLEIYVDGVREDRDYAADMYTATLNGIRIGAFRSSLYLSGSIDDPRIYSRALSASEILRLYNMNNCKVGGCLVFDGTNDYINISEPDLGTISGNFSGTMSAWIKRSGGTAFQTVAVAGSAVALQSFALGINGNGEGSFSADFNGGNGRKSAAGLIPLNTWTFLTVVKTPGAIESTTKLYLNGVEVSSSGQTGTPNFVTDKLYIGTWTNLDYYFNGLIDDVRIYDRALSATEVYQLYNSPVYSRYFYVDNVNRTACGSGNITASTATVCSGSVNDIGEDPGTQKITVGTSWNLKGANEVLENSIFVTRWINSVSEQSDWGGGDSVSGAVSDFGNDYFEYSTISTTTAGSIKISGI